MSYCSEISRNETDVLKHGIWNEGQHNYAKITTVGRPDTGCCNINKLLNSYNFKREKINKHYIGKIRKPQKK